MPLRALLDGKQLYSFLHLDDEWQQLKQNDIRKRLKMACCDRRAIPKTSKLGTPYFAHHKRGDCSSAPESAEHLYLKSLVAKTAIEFGWNVVTEQRGETPDGEAWVADVFCSKGSSKLAFEIQWSYQHKEEFERRQAKYVASGVRCAWLYRLHAGREFTDSDIGTSDQLPIFGFREGNERLSFRVPKFQINVETFIRGIFSKQLKWFPIVGDELEVRVYPFNARCWRCEKWTKVISHIDILSSEFGYLEGARINDKKAAIWLANNLSQDDLSPHKIPQIRSRYCKTEKKPYLANECYHCGAFFHPDLLWNNVFRFGDRDQKPLLSKQWFYNPEQIELKSNWRFIGSLSDTSQSFNSY